MTWLNKLFGRTLASFKPSGEAAYQPPVMFACGKWVVYNDRLGIITDLSNNGEAQIHLVNNAGETIGSLPAPIGQVRLAKYDEIPASRKQRSREEFAALGYF